MKAVSLPGKILEAPMAAERLSMRTIKEVLRLKWEKQLSNRQIAASCNETFEQRQILVGDGFSPKKFTGNADRGTREPPWIPCALR
jgi:hypothetical protein